MAPIKTKTLSLSQLYSYQIFIQSKKVASCLEIRFPRHLLDFVSIVLIYYYGVVEIVKVLIEIMNRSISDHN